jgi:hypothetical protein
MIEKAAALQEAVQLGGFLSIIANFWLENPSEN